MKDFIPFNRPFIVGKELFYISQAVLGGHLAGDGKFTKLCQLWMEEHFNAKKVLLTPTCTAALDMTALLCNVQPGDEVIMPSYTFSSTANAFVLQGARIRFVDIREDTMNIDELKIEEAISDKTKVIVPVHYAGVGAEMDKILEIARAHDLLVVEDAAQGVNATYKERYLGTIGNLGTYSFHETKNFISGEGGALVINDDRFWERSEIIREKGTNRSKFFRGEVDKYTWVDVGSSYLPSEIVAAFLYAQLEESETITRKRRKIFSYYAEAFASLESQGLVKLPSWPKECQHNAHLFYLVLPTSDLRDGLISYLKKNNIHSVFHYVPLHSSPMGKQVSSCKVELPITDSISSRLLRLPCYYELTQEEQDYVIHHVKIYFKKYTNKK